MITHGSESYINNYRIIHEGNIAEYIHGDNTTTTTEIGPNGEITVKASGASASSADVARLDRAINGNDGLRNLQSNLKRTSGVILPLYIYPSDPVANATYNTVIDLAKKYRDVPTIVALNPSSGPGPSVDENYKHAIDRLIGADVQCIGYVSSAYMDRTLAAVKEDALKWTQLYPSIRGIWVDEMPNGYGTKTVSEIIAYYHELYKYCKSSLNLDYVYVNPGSTIVKAIWDGGVCDNIAWYETSGMPTLAQLTEGSAYYDSMFEIPAHAKTVLAHSVTSWDLNAAKLVQKHCGWIFVTNDVMPNPYDALTPYLEDMYKLLSSSATQNVSNHSELLGKNAESNYLHVTASEKTTWSGKQDLIPTGLATEYYAGDKNWHTLDKNAVGLGNVDNTRDVDKAISTATQNALNQKANTNHNHTISDVTNLRTELDGKVDKVAGKQLMPDPNGDAKYLLNGAGNWYQFLGNDGFLRPDILPPLAIKDTFTVSSSAEMLALNAQRGDMAIRIDLTPNEYYILAADTPAVASAWKGPISSPLDGIQTINGKSGSNVTLNHQEIYNLNADSSYLHVTSAEKTTWTGKQDLIPTGLATEYYAGDKAWHTLNKTAVGLGNVDNTSDADKAISTATQNALNQKANISHSHGISDISGLRAELDSKLSSTALRWYVNTAQEFTEALANPNVIHIHIAPYLLLLDSNQNFTFAGRESSSLHITGGALSFAPGTYTFNGTMMFPIVCTNHWGLSDGVVINCNLEFPVGIFVSSMTIGDNATGSGPGTITINNAAGKSGIGFAYTHRGDNHASKGLGSTIVGTSSVLSGFGQHPWLYEQEVSVWSNRDLLNALTSNKPSLIINANYDNAALHWDTIDVPISDSQVTPKMSPISVSGYKHIKSNKSIAITGAGGPGYHLPISFSKNSSLIIDASVHFDAMGDVTLSANQDAGASNTCMMYIDNITLHTHSEHGVGRNIGNVTILYGKVSKHVGGAPLAATTGLKMTTSSGQVYVNNNNMRRYNRARNTLSNRISNAFEFAQSLYVWNPADTSHNTGQHTLTNCTLGYALENPSQNPFIVDGVVDLYRTSNSLYWVGGLHRSYVAEGTGCIRLTTIATFLENPIEFTLRCGGGATGSGLTFNVDVILGHNVRLILNNQLRSRLKNIKLLSYYSIVANGAPEQYSSSANAQLWYQVDDIGSNALADYVLAYGEVSSVDVVSTDVDYPADDAALMLKFGGNLAARILRHWSPGGKHIREYAKIGTGITEWDGLSQPSPGQVRITNGSGYVNFHGTSKLVAWRPSTGVGAEGNIKYEAYQDVTVNFGTSKVVTIYVDSDGVIQQYQGYLTNSQRRQNILLCTCMTVGDFVGQPDGNIRVLLPTTDVMDNGAQMIREMYDLIGSPKTGFSVSASQFGDSLLCSSGKIFMPGANWQNDPTNPNIHTYASTGSAISWYACTRGTIDSVPTSTIETTKYNPSGDTKSNIPTDKYVNHRIYYLPEHTVNASGANFALQLGQKAYGSLGEATMGLASEKYTPNPDLSRGILIGAITVRQGETGVRGGNIILTDAWASFGGGGGTDSSTGISVTNIAYTQDAFNLNQAQSSPTLPIGLIMCRINAPVGGRYNYAKIFSKTNLSLSSSAYCVVYSYDSSTSIATRIATSSFTSGSGFIKSALSSSVDIQPGTDYWIGVALPVSGINSLPCITPHHTLYTNSETLYYSSMSITNPPSTITINSDTFPAMSMPWVQLAVN